MTSSSWQIALAKLIGLILVLPFAVTYLHLYYYTNIQDEYCFVGPHTSSISGKNYNNYHAESSSGIMDSSIAVDNAIIASQNSAVDVVTSQLFGIYSPQQQQKRSKSKKNDRRQFHQTYASANTAASSASSILFSSSRFFHAGWPSITQISDMISSPTSQLSHKNGKQNNSNSGNSITFVEMNETTRKWCIESSSSSLGEVGTAKWCSADLTNEHDKRTIYLYPPSGVYERQSSPQSSSSLSLLPTTIYITCPTPTLQTQPPPKKTRHNEQLFRQNKNIQFILQHPATVLLLLLNIGLAFHYWNHRIHPSLVCKQYNQIVDNHEWWRGLTGATAHFEPLHIGFNMMSLHTLGRELEGEYFGSINFFMYNVALVVMTTIVMMGMVYGRIRWGQHRHQHPNSSQDQRQLLHLRETSTVGYSGVLFAWMVISTLERDQPTCPIPFFNDVCFSTYTFGQFKFNIAPVVSLFVAQFIMPRVSFMGHLAGIICGFGLHWGWPPIEIGSSNVLIGGVFLFGNLFWRRGVVPVVPLTPPDENDHDDDNQLLSLLLENGQDGIDGILISLPDSAADDVENGNATTSSMDPFARGKEKKKELEMEEMRRKHKTLESIRNLIGLVTVLSFLFFDWISSIALSQCLLLAYFIFGTRSSFIVWACTQAKVENDVITPEKQRCGMIWRGYFMSCVLAIVVDAMSVAGWIHLQTFISSGKTKLLFGLVPTILFMLLRISINILGMVIASKVLHDMGQVSYVSGGIFVRVFSRVLTCSNAIGDGVFLSQRPLWTAFEGRGIRLGGGELLARISRSRSP